MPTESETGNAYAVQMAFENYLSDFLRELTGFVRVLKQDEKQPTIYWESYYKPAEYKDMNFICNLDGGLNITHSIHQFFNKHILLGNIKQSQVARKAGEITRQVFGDMIFDAELYEIRDVDTFANKALTTQDQLEMYFTNVANSGIRDWSRSILTITQMNDGRQVVQPAAQSSPGLLERIRGQKDF
jgi:hypothetical protein